MNTLTREERRSALDEFAAGGAQDPVTLPVATLSHEPLSQVTGAQQVAIRRDEIRALARIKELAAATGDGWYYRFPVKNKKTGKTDYIEGPSIKLANDVARLYGNCEVDARLAQDLGDSWYFLARFIDLETGFALTRPFLQRKSAAKLGGDDDARRLDIAFQIGVSKAIRNAVVNALQTFADFAYEEARESIVDRIGKDLEKWRRTTSERVKELVSLDRVEAVVGRPLKEWLAPDVARVIAMGKAITDGMATVDETFPPLARDTAATAKAELDKFAAGKETSGESDTSAAVGDSDGPQDGKLAPQAPPAEETAAVAAGAELGDPEEYAAEMKAHAISVLLKTASNVSVPAERRLKDLEDARDAFPDLPTRFVDTCIETAGKVIRGELKTAEQARKYLEGLK
jgi:hypothetical protein